MIPVQRIVRLSWLSLPGRAVILAAFTVLWSAAVVLNLSPYLRGPADYPPEWRWWLAPSFDLAPIRLIGPGLAAGAMVLWWRWAHSSERIHLGHLLCLAALGFALVLAVQFVSAAGIPLMAQLISPAYDGYFPSAVKIEALDTFLAKYPDGMQDFDGRLRTHPPGNTLFFWLFYRLADGLPDDAVEIAGPILRAHTVAEWAGLYSDTQLVAAAFAGLTVVVIAVLTVVPLYYLGADTVGQRQAVYALILYLFAPAIVLFAPVVDLTYTLTGATALWLAYRGFVRGSYALLTLSGAVLSISLFMSFSNLPLLLSLGVMGVALRGQAYLSDWSATLRRLSLQGLAVALGGSLVWALFRINPVQVFRAATAIQQGDRLSRNYWTWLFYNPYDLFLFAGLPMGLLFLSAILRLWVKLVRRRPVTHGDILFISILLGMGTLFISGVMRGEAARTLLFYFPFMAVLGQANRPVWSPFELTVAAATTLVQTTAFYLGLRVYH